MEKAYGKPYTPDCAKGKSVFLSPRDFTEGPGIKNKPISGNDTLLQDTTRLESMDKEI